MEKKAAEKSKKECFVIMPFDKKEGYGENHFTKIYKNIFKPAIEAAGYKAHRADDEKSASEINIEILTKLVEADLALCDISSLNPNVMYELGIRAAFDLPTVTVAEVGTKIPFDFYSKRTFFYRNRNDHDEVPEDVRKLTESIKATLVDTSPSLIKLLGLNTSASIKEIEADAEGNAILMLRDEIKKLNQEVRGSKHTLPIPDFWTSKGIYTEDFSNEPTSNEEKTYSINLRALGNQELLEYTNAILKFPSRHERRFLQFVHYELNRRIKSNKDMGMTEMSKGLHQEFILARDRMRNM